MYLSQPTQKRLYSSNGKSLRTLLQVTLLSVCSVAMLGVTGCQATKNVWGKVDDGSLNYQNATKLEPIELPINQQTAPFTPIFPTPIAGENTLDLENEASKRYQLPKPHRQVSVSSVE